MSDHFTTLRSKGLIFLSADIKTKLFIMLEQSEKKLCQKAHFEFYGRGLEFSEERFQIGVVFTPTALL